MKRNKSIVMSYMNFRTLIGILGMALPFICYIWCYTYNNKIVLDSISMHYYTNIRDIFVGILVTFSVFLITYKGYDMLDNTITLIIGVCGIGIALFPCGNKEITEKVSFLMIDSSKTSIIHYCSAGLFFISLAFNSLFLFTKSNGKVIRKTRKYYRNIIYKTCGIIILLSLVCMVIIMIFASEEFRTQTHLILILETIMLLFFGISWLVKGGAIARDKKLTTAS